MSKSYFPGNVSCVQRTLKTGIETLEIRPDPDGAFSNANIGEFVDKLIAASKATKIPVKMYDVETRTSMPLAKRNGLVLAFGKWDDRTDPYAKNERGECRNKPYLLIPRVGAAKPAANRGKKLF